MALDAERIVDLAPAGQFGLVDRYLPDPYRRALTRHGDAMASLTRAARDTLRRSLSELEAVQRSRALAFFNDLTDGKLLGALHDQEPWPEDDTETFRTRLGRVAALAMRGAATADRLLALAALAGNGTALPSGSIARSVPPETDYRFVIQKKDAQGQTQSQTLQGRTAPGQTRQFFVKPATGGLFPVDVIDAPLRRYDADIAPLPGPHYRFALDNPASENLAGLEATDPLLWPDPTFSITAGATAFGPFALIQTGQAQVFIVNRVLSPGATLEFSLRDMVWNHQATGSTTLGPLTCLGGKDALYAGFGLSADDHLIPPPDTDHPTGPLLMLRLKPDLTFTGAQSTGVPKDLAALAESPLKMPSFLGEGRSQWRILAIAPHDASDPDIHKAQFAPVRADADITLSARWFGRRPGEFSVILPDTALAPDQGGPLTHRTLWLNQMIERFKLAGTVRIAKDLLFSPDDILKGLTEIALRDSVRATDGLDVIEPMHMHVRVNPVDRIEIISEEDLELFAGIPSGGRDETDKASAGPVSVAHPVDVMTIAPVFPPNLRDSVTPRDSIEILPDVPISARDSVAPRDAITLTDAEARPDILVSSGHPTDRMTLTPGLPDSFRSVTSPRDSIAILPTVTLDLISTTAPRDTVALDPGGVPDRPDIGRLDIGRLDLGRLNVRPTVITPLSDTLLRTRTITLKSAAAPRDRITIRRLRRR